MSKIVDVAVGIVVEHRDDGPWLLITRRPEHTVLGGLWEFPGGKIEQGETLTQSLQRELMEEVGIAIAVERELDLIEHEYPHAQVRLHPCLCRHTAGQPRNLHVSDHRWIRPGELDDYAFPQGNAALIKWLKNHFAS